MNIQGYVRLAGVLFLLTIAGGFFGEMYVPMKIIAPRDAATTAQNLRTSESLFRLGFAAYLIEALCDVGLAWIFYLLLRPVEKNVALLSVFLGLISTATFVGSSSRP